MRSRSICAAAAALLAVSGCSEPDASYPGEASRPRNVLLISIDTLRPDHLGAYGYERPTSPVIDVLAKEGVLFERCVSQAPWTAPSHASMLTSLYPSVLKMGKFLEPGTISPAAETVAEVLQAAGFRTCAVTENAYVSPDQGMDQGFDTFVMKTNTEESVATVEQWLEEIGVDEPFFLFFHTYDVHEYDPEGEYAERFVRPYEGMLAEATKSVAEILQSPNQGGHVARFTEAEWRYVRDLYDGTIAYVDRWLGGLLDLLEERGVLDDTLIVLTSDHGEEFGEHGSSGHGFTVYDENVLVPLIVKHPSLTARRVVPQVRLLDIAPTVTDLLGLSTPPAWQGTSLVPMMMGAELELVALTENAHRPYKSLRTNDHKYIIGKRRPRQMLFDLRADPGEASNLSDGAAVRDALRAQLLSQVQDNAYRMSALAPAEATDMSAEMIEQLAALGYLGASDGEPHVDADEWIQILESSGKNAEH
jgi:arylsulfatase A-like enzyme